MFSSFIGMKRISSANSNASVIVYSFTESGFKFLSSHLARLKLQVPVADKIGVILNLALCTHKDGPVLNSSEKGKWQCLQAVFDAGLSAHLSLSEGVGESVSVVVHESLGVCHQHVQI